MSRRTSRTGAAGALVVAGALALSGCSANATTDTAANAAVSSSAASSTVAADAFPVTFEHMYGSTTVATAPVRVATWGWGATDAVLALGVMPVAIPSDEYGGGEDRITPWVQKAIDAIGGEVPVLLDNSSFELSVEALLATNPDVLISSYSGLTQEEYDAVTAAGIAVIAPEKELWATPWRDVITDTGKALGLESKASDLLDDLNGQVADAAAAHPEFSGTSIAYVDDDVDTFYIYLPADARVEILQDLGFVTPPGVLALDSGESTFYTTVSYEKLDEVDADVIFTQAEEQAALDEFLTSARGQLIPAVAKGAVAAIVGAENTDAVSPTALTVPWTLPIMVEKLAAATAIAKG